MHSVDIVIFIILSTMVLYLCRPRPLFRFPSHHVSLHLFRICSPDLRPGSRRGVIGTLSLLWESIGKRSGQETDTLTHSGL